MATTYTPIATQILSSATASLTFSSIPSTYTDLVLVASSGATAANSNMRLQFNSDTAANYGRTILTGTGSAASASRQTGQVWITLTNSAVLTTTLAESIIITNIQNYSNTTTYKTTLSRSNTASAGVEANIGAWLSTAAISSITVLNTTTTFTTGSTFSLYGIKAA